MSDDTSQPQHPATDDRAAWRVYWQAQGQPWRTEPEIDAERQAYLAERRAVMPDIERGIYPFRDENSSIKLTRADVEWLLATHESGGVRGPVAWDDATQRLRLGIDLGGGDLRGVSLRRLPLARSLAGLDPDDWRFATPEQREMATVHLERANLRFARFEYAFLYEAHLEGADFFAAHLEGASLRAAHMEGTSLVAAYLEGTFLLRAHLEGKAIPEDDLNSMRTRLVDFPAVLQPANLRRAYFDAATVLTDLTLGNMDYGYISVADAHWADANLAVVDWSPVTQLGDEREAIDPRDPQGKAKGPRTRIRQFGSAVRAYRQLAIALRSQGLNEDADRFAYRAQFLQRQVLRRQRELLRWLASVLLDAVAGYGYRPVRSVFTYVVVVLAFAAVYFGLGGVHGQPLSWNESLVVSLTAFHGRGFFATAFQPGDPQAAVAAIEAVFGLLIEITFIATFTQRFFAR